MTQTVDNETNLEEITDIGELAKLLTDATISDREGGADSQGQEADPSQPESDTGAEMSEAEQDAPEAAQNLTVKALAEKLGIEPAELYQSLRIDLAEGQSVSLGEFKDRAKDLVEADALLAEASERQLTVENELLAKNQAMVRQMQQLGIQLTPEAQREADEQAKQYRAHQASLALQAMPEWKDEKARGVDIARIERIATEYGFSEAEQGILLDHRLLKLFRDFQRQRETVKAVRKARKKPTGGRQSQTLTRGGSDVADIVSKAQSGQMSQKDAIAALAQKL